MKNKPVILVLALSIAAISPFLIHPAEGYALKTFNNVSIKIGWLKVPPLVGDTNQIDIFVYNGTSDKAPPFLKTALDNMTITIEYNGQTKDITSYFSSSRHPAGLYKAVIIPTQIGTYSAIIKGNIDGVAISATTYTLQEVLSDANYSFP